MLNLSEPYPVSFSKKYMVLPGMKKPEEMVFGEAKYVDLVTFHEKTDKTPAKTNNEKEYNNSLFDTQNEWRGGSREELFKPKDDLSAYENYLKKLTDNKTISKVAAKFYESTRVRRTRSAHDGEWDYDKRYEVEPFMRREKRKVNLRVIKLNAAVCFSAFVSAQQINEYGAFIAAITSIIERSGALVEIVISNAGVNVIYDSEIKRQYTEILLKRPDEYLPIQSVLRAFSSNFFRRIIFGTMIMSAEFIGKDITGGYGSPHTYGKTFEIIGNTLNIYSVPEMDKQNQICEKLAEALLDKKQMEK